MKFSLIAKSSEELIWASVAGSKPQKKDSAFEFKVESFHGNYNNKNWIFKLKSGLVLSLMDITATSEINDKIAAKEDYLKFAFLLSGRGNVDYNFIDAQLNRDLADGMLHHSYLYFSPQIEGLFRIIAKHRFQLFSIHISPLVLLNYFNGQFDIGPFALRDILAGSDQTSFFHTQRISTPMMAAIHQILNCPYSGPMRQLFMESKAMELITYKLDQIVDVQTIKNKSPRLSMDDYDRLKKAAGILIKNLEDPPGIFDLAKTVGTTHTRLTLSFRQIYGTTAFGYLRQIRLEKAKQLLERDGLNVTQAAYQVGYNSIPSFSKAFSDYFGMAPTKYIKRLF